MPGRSRGRCRHELPACLVIATIATGVNAIPARVQASCPSRASKESSAEAQLQEIAEGLHRSRLQASAGQVCGPVHPNLLQMTEDSKVAPIRGVGRRLPHGIPLVRSELHSAVRRGYTCVEMPFKLDQPSELFGVT